MLDLIMHMLNQQSFSQKVMTTQLIVANRQSVRLKKTRNNAETE